MNIWIAFWFVGLASWLCALAVFTYAVVAIHNVHEMFTALFAMIISLVWMIICNFARRVAT